MARVIAFEGRQISVPDDATDEEVAGIIDGGQAQQQQPDRSILATNPVPHTGYAGQVRAMQGGPDKVAPRSFGELGKSYGDMVAGAATGAPSGIIGMPGNVESLGRHALATVGAPVSTQTILPTSSDVGNAIAGGPPANQDVAAGRMIGEFVGPGAIAKGLKMGSAAIANPITGGGPTAAAQAAHGAGFALPPAMASAKPGIISQLLSGSGKAKLQQAASAKNQEVTNRLASEGIGLPGDTALGPEAFHAVRADASKAYTAVANSVPNIAPDEAFQATVGSLGERMSEAAKAFPGIIKNDQIENLTKELQATQEFSPQAGLELVRHLRSNASANLRAFDDPGKQALGLSQRHAADAVDDLIERRLTAADKPDLVNAYRDARQQLARTYDVEAATNPATGDVSARMLGALANKGRPLSGQLKDIADAARAFPKAMQIPSSFGGEEKLGILDYGAAIATHGATVPLSLARPGARSLILSAPYQKALMKGPSNSNSYASRVGALAAPDVADRLIDRSK